MSDLSEGLRYQLSRAKKANFKSIPSLDDLKAWFKGKGVELSSSDYTKIHDAYVAYKQGDAAPVKKGRKRKSSSEESVVVTVGGKRVYSSGGKPESKPEIAAKPERVVKSESRRYGRR